MTPEVRVPPLRWALPLAQLFVCVVILWPMRPGMFREIRSSLRAYGVTHDSPESDRVVPHGVIPFDLADPEVQRRIRDARSREWLVATLNLPGGLPDLLHAMVSSAHSEWTPKGIFMWTWRDISWPIIGMFFWWLAGRSIDALFLARHKILRSRIRLWEVLISLPVLAFGGIMAVAMCFEHGRHEESPSLLLVVFGIMWFALGSSTVAAWIVQWRLRKRLALGAVAEATTLTSGS